MNYDKEEKSDHFRDKREKIGKVIVDLREKAAEVRQCRENLSFLGIDLYKISNGEIRNTFNG